MIKNADGSYQNLYESNTEVAQYYPDMKATGDFTLTVSIAVVDKTPERSEESGYPMGSDIGIIISCGNGKELTIYTNKLNSSQAFGTARFFFRVNTDSTNTWTSANGFRLKPGQENPSHLGIVGAEANFVITRVSNTLKIYAADTSLTNPIFTFKDDGNIDTGTRTNITFGGQKTAVSEHVAAMMKAGSETRFGIYRGKQLKGAYKWNVELSA